MSDRFDGAEPGDRVRVTSNAQWKGRVGTLRRYQHVPAGQHGRTLLLAVVELDAAGRANARTVRVIAVRKAE